MLTLPTLPSDDRPETVSEPVVVAPVADKLAPVIAPEALTVAAETAPPVVTLPPVIRPDVDTLPAVAVPVTDTDDRIPTEVMFGCDAVVSVPAKKLAVTKLPRLALVETILPRTLRMFVVESNDKLPVPADKLPVRLALVVVILPLLSIIFFAGRPTLKPPTEFKGFIAILEVSFYYLLSI